MTEITHVVDKKYFVDERVWSLCFMASQTFIKEIDGGIEMEDVIHYNPFGPLGVLANYLFVQKKLGSIFVYRRKRDYLVI